MAAAIPTAHDEYLAELARQFVSTSLAWSYQAHRQVQDAIRCEPRHHRAEVRRQVEAALGRTVQADCWSA